ncbi:hypothetical protein PIB30_084813 [Stylosanthes scabra]|uniref:Uncharacterized protein n=1 Tax=Stylosanthes scabra TaxID=79078 RepID=A0ABU6QSN4_9FABA|nr:hypothetical protein [Stylosanthes scabra]
MDGLLRPFSSFHPLSTFYLIHLPNWVFCRSSSHITKPPETREERSIPRSQLRSELKIGAAFGCENIGVPMASTWLEIRFLTFKIECNPRNRATARYTRAAARSRKRDLYVTPCEEVKIDSIRRIVSIDLWMQIPHRIA